MLSMFLTIISMTNYVSLLEQVFTNKQEAAVEHAMVQKNHASLHPSIHRLPRPLTGQSRRNASLQSAIKETGDILQSD